MFSSHEEMLSLEMYIKRQKTILLHESVPAKYNPKHLLQTTKERQNELDRIFMKEYTKIFLQHLERVIEANTIELVIKRARLQSTNEGSHHQPETHIPTEAVSKNTPDEEAYTRITRKRPSLQDAPPRKQRKLMYFLEKGRHRPPNIR